MVGPGRMELGQGRRRIEGIIRRGPVVASLLVLLLAGLDLLRWSFGVEVLLRLIPFGGGLMMPLSALGLLAGAAALWLLRAPDAARGWRPWLGRVLAAIVAALGLITLAEYVFGVDPGLDLLFFPEAVTALRKESPGRPGLLAAASFAATGVSLLLLDTRSRVLREVAGYLLLGVAIVGLRSTIGYAYAVQGVYAVEEEGFGPALFPVMAFNSALSFIFLALGALLARPDRGLVRLAAADDAGGFIARRLLPAAIIVPVALGWLGTLGVRAELYSPEDGASLIVVSMILVLVLLTVGSARALSRLDRQRGRAVAALRERERLFRAIFENAGAGIGLVDPSGRVVAANPALANMLGYSMEELEGRNFVELRHPRDAGADRPLFDELVAGRRDSFRLETRFLRKDGRIAWGRLTTSEVRDGDGNARFFIALIDDITDRKQAEEAQRFLLEASRLFSGSLELDAVLESITRLIVPRRADYCIVDLLGEGDSIDRVAAAHADPEGQKLVDRLCAYSAGTKRGRGVPDVVRTGRAELQPEVSEDWLRAVTRNRRHLEVVRELGPRSAMMVPFVARGRVIGAMTLAWTRPGLRYGPDDLALAEELAGLAGLALDNAQLFQQSHEATQVRDRVLSVVAHDLRNPLNAVSLSAELMREQRPDPDPDGERERLEVIERSVAQANRLIQDLLDIARIEAGVVPLERERLDARALVREAVSLHRPLAERQSIRLEAEIPERLDAIDADHDRVLQVFSNLIGNALRYSPEGEVVGVSADQRDGEVRFSVSDRGPGIPEKQRHRLFEPFWKARKETEGAGLGLAIAHAIVEAHGGTIGVESRDDHGSTFWFRLPTARPDAPRREQPSD